MPLIVKHPENTTVTSQNSNSEETRHAEPHSSVPSRSGHARRVVFRRERAANRRYGRRSRRCETNNRIGVYNMDEWEAITITTTGARSNRKESTITLQMSPEDLERLLAWGVRVSGQFVTFTSQAPKLIQVHEPSAPAAPDTNFEWREEPLQPGGKHGDWYPKGDDDDTQQ